VFSKYELDTIATDWNNISTLVQESVSNELSKFDYVAVKGLDITGLKIAEEYRAAIEQKQIAQQQLLRAKTEVQIAEQEALKFQTLTRSLNDSVLYKLFLDKWDGKTKVVPPIRGGQHAAGDCRANNGMRQSPAQPRVAACRSAMASAPRPARSCCITRSA
jgi:hypothetical protein